MVDMPGGIPEGHTVVVSSRYVDFLINPNVSVIGGIHVPVASMRFSAAGFVVVRDGDTGLPAAVANPTRRSLTYRIIIFKSLVDKHLGKGAYHKKHHRNKSIQFFHIWFHLICYKNRDCFDTKARINCNLVLKTTIYPAANMVKQRFTAE